MANIQVVSKENHSDKRWRRSKGFEFAKNDSICPLVLSELPAAMMKLPIAFIQREGSYYVAAVQGLMPKTNSFVADDGSWLGDYIPAQYRAHPFLLARNEVGSELLCLQGDVQLFGLDDDGEDFFDKEGEPVAEIKEILQFLNSISLSQKAALRACELLKQESLFTPWKIQLTTDEGERNVEGLFKINEEALSKLSADSLVILRDAGAFGLIYCQLLSMQNIHKLVDMLKSQLAQKNTFGKELYLDASNESGNISFDSY